MEIVIEQPNTGAKTKISKLYNVVYTEGLTPVKANINTTTNGVVDGTFYNSSYLTQRPILIKMIPDGDIEEKRLELYRVFRAKKKVKVHVKSKNRNLHIECVVEELAVGLHERKQCISVSLIAPQPYFLNENETTQEQSAVTSNFEFPFEIPENGIEFGNITRERDITIRNDGEEASGLIIEIAALDTVINPVIYNKTTKEKFAIRITMEKGDKIEINTHKGRKKIELKRGNVAFNILNKIEKNTKWLTVEMGENIFSYECESGEEDMQIKYRFSEMYGGI